MATLPDADRLRIWRGLGRWWSNVREPVAINKEDLKAAVAATDVWIDNNAVNFNNALPTAAKAQLTVTQKSFLLVAVILMRHNINILRTIFPEVE
jgi:hypothetical protein